jgi:hypothetical protein
MKIEIPLTEGEARETALLIRRAYGITGELNATGAEIRSERFPDWGKLHILAYDDREDLDALICWVGVNRLKMKT